jgi:hypothetical protein
MTPLVIEPATFWLVVQWIHDHLNIQSYALCCLKSIVEVMTQEPFAAYE